MDVILKRESYRDSLKILTNCYEEYTGVIADITILNIYYVASKQAVNVKEFLDIVTDSFGILGSDNKIITLALELKNKDLEDNIQKKSGCDLIVSNDRNFYCGDIKVLSAKEFIKDKNG